LVLFPIVIGQVYGANNFGKYFAFLELASSAASIVIPQIVSAVEASTHRYYHVSFGIAGLLITSAIGMFLKALSKS
jgi:hypothetical protein